MVLATFRKSPDAAVRHILLDRELNRIKFKLSTYQRTRGLAALYNYSLRLIQVGEHQERECCPRGISFLRSQHLFPPEQKQAFDSLEPSRESMFFCLEVTCNPFCGGPSGIFGIPGHSTRRSLDYIVNVLCIRERLVHGPHTTTRRQFLQLYLPNSLQSAPSGFQFAHIKSGAAISMP